MNSDNAPNASTQNTKRRYEGESDGTSQGSRFQAKAKASTLRLYFEWLNAGSGDHMSGREFRNFYAALVPEVRRFLLARYDLPPDETGGVKTDHRHLSAALSALDLFVLNRESRRRRYIAGLVLTSEKLNAITRQYSNLMPWLETLRRLAIDALDLIRNHQTHSDTQLEDAVDLFRAKCDHLLEVAFASLQHELEKSGTPLPTLVRKRKAGHAETNSRTQSDREAQSQALIRLISKLDEDSRKMNTSHAEALESYAKWPQVIASCKTIETNDLFVLLDLYRAIKDFLPFVKPAFLQEKALHRLKDQFPRKREVKGEYPDDPDSPLGTYQNWSKSFKESNVEVSDLTEWEASSDLSDDEDSHFIENPDETHQEEETNPEAAAVFRSKSFAWRQELNQLLHTILPASLGLFDLFEETRLAKEGKVKTELELKLEKKVDYCVQCQFIIERCVSPDHEKGPTRAELAEWLGISEDKVIGREEHLKRISRSWIETFMANWHDRDGVKKHDAQK